MFAREHCTGRATLCGAASKLNERAPFACEERGRHACHHSASRPHLKRLQPERDGNISVATHAQTLRGVIFGRLLARRRNEPRDRSTLWGLSKQRCARSWETAR